jgi:hypothetical protein
VGGCVSLECFHHPRPILAVSKGVKYPTVATRIILLQNRARFQLVEVRSGGQNDWQGAEVIILSQPARGFSLGVFNKVMTRGL